MSKFSEDSKQLIYHICSFLRLVSQEKFAQVTLMDSDNLAVVFAPGMIRSDSSDPLVAMARANQEKDFVTNLIQNLDLPSDYPCFREGSDGLPVLFDQTVLARKALFIEIMEESQSVEPTPEEGEEGDVEEKSEARPKTLQRSNSARLPTSMKIKTQDDIDLGKFFFLNILSSSWLMISFGGRINIDIISCVKEVLGERSFGTT